MQDNSEQPLVYRLIERAGFPKENISETLEQQYKMLDKLKVKYERIDY
ncbi:hypothetical protein [Bacillus clarus]|nr:hypothetical protein [Bacillus clarus]